MNIKEQTYLNDLAGYHPVVPVKYLSGEATSTAVSAVVGVASFVCSCIYFKSSYFTT
jgi:hypothetical protein